ncbi:MAG: YabP/YqfC family sporulation protein [Clostridia bacterium]|nr:YabP/YqfC family sporulation protein [Clostridia bacterium]
MQENQNNSTHVLTVEQCKKITATDIESVNAFSSQQIVLTYSQGKIVVSGANLKIINFSKATGAFCAVGEISGVKYGVKNAKLIQKLLK